MRLERVSVIELITKGYFALSIARSSPNQVFYQRMSTGIQYSHLDGKVSEMFTHSRLTGGLFAGRSYGSPLAPPPEGRSLLSGQCGRHRSSPG